MHFPIFHDISQKTLTTLHTQPSHSDSRDMYDLWPQYALVALSESHKRSMPNANWAGVVNNGLPLSMYHMGTGSEGYIAFLGRLSPDKGAHHAIAIAMRANRKLKIAARVDPYNLPYFRDALRPFLDHPLIEFVGEIDDDQKTAFLGEAEALLFPIAWPEPFGLVMIEAMACGTPTIAFRSGSVEEILEDGVSGFIVDDEATAVQAVYPEYVRTGLPAWIIGAEHGLGSVDAAAIMKVWPERGPIEPMTPDAFNAEIGALADSHCT